MPRQIGWTAAIVAALMTFGALSAIVVAQEQGRYGTQKVVYHLNEDGGEGDKNYLRALNNVQNHINAVGGDKLDLKIVVHGDGVNILKHAVTNQRLQGQVINLKAQKVSFLVCKNTLVQRKIDPEKDLFEVEKSDIVPSGVAEVARLQQQGYAYLKP
jgi:intracellular sulfur oxidation DsrE/DsrF family protein